MARGGNTQSGLAFADDIDRQQMSATFNDLFDQPFATAAKSVRQRLAAHKAAELYVVGGAVRDVISGRAPKDLDIMVRGVPENELVEILKGLAGDERLEMYQALATSRRQKVLDALKVLVREDQRARDQLPSEIQNLTTAIAAKRLERERLIQEGEDLADLVWNHEQEAHDRAVIADRKQALARLDRRLKWHKPILEMDLEDFDEHVARVPSARRVGYLPTLHGRLGREGDHFTVTRYHAPDGTDVEVVLPRNDISTGDGHKDVAANPDHLMSVEQDMARRDFTVNAMAWDLTNECMIDPFDGQRDLQNKVLRTVSENSFKDDRLRMIRGLVLAGRYGLDPDETCDAQYQDQAEQIIHVTRPRIMEEILGKLMPSADPAFGVSLGERYGLISYSLPGMSLDVDALKRAQEATKDPVLRLATLLHSNNPAKARKALHEVSYESAVSDRVAHLLSQEKIPDTLSMQEVGSWAQKMHSRQIALDVIRLRSYVAGESEVEAKVARYRKALDRPIYRGEIALSGRDLIEMGMKPGEQFGQLIARAQKAVWADPSINDLSKLRAILEL